MALLLNSMLTLCIVCLTAVLAMTVIPACLVIFHETFVIGSCGFEKNKTSESTIVSHKRELLMDKITQLEKKIVSIDCPATEAVATPIEPQDINIQEWKEKKISTLENCWELVGNQYEVENINTKKITTYHTWNLCFDAEGTGSQKLISSVNECQGNISAEFNSDGSLQILDEADLECDSGHIIFRREMTCTLDDFGKAKCTGYQPDRPGGYGEDIFELVRK